MFRFRSITEGSPRNKPGMTRKCNLKFEKKKRAHFYRVESASMMCAAESASNSIQNESAIIRSFKKKMETGSCSFPGCKWEGLKSNFNRHKNGAGIGEKRRLGQHEGEECEFVPMETRQNRNGRLSFLQGILNDVRTESSECTQLHSHLQGEFNRRAGIAQKLKHVMSQPFAQSHIEFMNNSNQIHEYHKEQIVKFMDMGTSLHKEVCMK